MVMTNVLRVNPSQPNAVEVTAYNGAGLMASEPLRFQIDAFGVSPGGGPRLYVLAIGAGNYTMTDYRLDFPEIDAGAIAQSLAAAGKKLFTDVIPLSLTGPRATEVGISNAFERLKTEVKPTDVFILFLSGHGENRIGRYYYVPQDFDTTRGDIWMKKWIGQDKWETWLNGIVASKQLIILDTCEGGAALGLVRGRAARETAMDQLQYATGRSIIAAAANDARESTQLGHGVLTYAILEALKQPTDANVDADKPVTVFGLAQYVQKQVLEIRQRIWGEPVGSINKLTQNDFPIGYRIPINIESIAIDRRPDTRYVVLRAEQVRKEAKTNADVNRSIAAGTEVNVLRFENAWALIAKDGMTWGYIPADALAKLI